MINRNLRMRENDYLSLELQVNTGKCSMQIYYWYVSLVVCTLYTQRITISDNAENFFSYFLEKC